MSDPEIEALRAGLLESLAVIDRQFNTLNVILDDPDRLRAVDAVLRRMSDREIRTLDSIVSQAKAATGMKWVALVLLDEENARVVASDEKIPSSERSQSYCQMVVAAGDTWSVTDTRKNGFVSRWRSTVEYNVGAYMGVPVFADDECIGALCMFQPDPKVWSEADEALLKTFARQVERALA